MIAALPGPAGDLGSALSAGFGVAGAAALICLLLAGLTPRRPKVTR